MRGLSAKALSSGSFGHFNRRRRRATHRVANANARIQEQAFTPGFPRLRQFVSVQNLFAHANLQPPEIIIEQKVRKKGKCTVFDIGAGIGAALGTALLNERLTPLRDKIELIGMDVFPVDPKMEKETGVKMITGNALTTPFPKADLIFSQVTAGYIGHIGILVRKSASALDKEGIAVLHVNKEGTKKEKELIKDMEKLKENIEKIKIPRCRVHVVHGSYMDFNFPTYVSGDDLIIIIRKD
ncbi:hypothetical protein KKE06_02835 [Candidatus Micrarchaeota archaeon]|nr:hypothetical protein [Candidatus Micrarchaeota archaeon]MBU1931028.1 hypothetical protein [Candidatus Micrarchaeota archaeon]